MSKAREDLLVLAALVASLADCIDRLAKHPYYTPDLIRDTEGLLEQAEIVMGHLKERGDEQSA